MRAEVNASIAGLQAELTDMERDEKGQNQPLKYPELGMEDREDRKKVIGRQIQVAQEYLAAAPAYATGEPREVRQPRQRVSQAIQRALNAIEEKNNGGNVAKHLASTHKGGRIEMGSILRYVGDKTWVT
jgi:hypothetical protein